MEYSMKRAAKKHSQPAPEKKQLRLASADSKQPLQAFYLFFSLSFLIITGVIITLITNKTGVHINSTRFWDSQITVSQMQFLKLKETLVEKGPLEFFKQKGLLKIQLQNILENIPEEKSEGIYSMVLYLYPELLSDNDLEKTAAITLFKDVQTDIETEVSRMKKYKRMNDLRANIWNYENPSRENAKITQTAQNVLDLYEVLASSLN
jgi:hypothetical protein